MTGTTTPPVPAGPEGGTVRARTGETDLELYTATALRVAGEVIGRYSTSFSWACRVLPPDARRDIAAIYAMVRVADEVVDGAAEEAGLPSARVSAALDAYERACEDALDTGFSTDLVLHAFADVSRRHGITAELTRPFFVSMRADLTVAEHGEDSLAAYIHGSAEVVGLMCLQVFLSMDGTRADGPADRAALRAAASRLGAAFQKVNFLRDLAADHDALGRTYFSGAAPEALTEERKAELLADLDADLDAALPGILALDPRAARAVLLAHGLFAELSRRLAATPAAELARRRVRVPDPVKARIAVRVLAASPAGIGRRGRPLPAGYAEDLAAHQDGDRRP
ncbi:phytoene/squalene synthase family protein [Micrococcus porci]|uniref:phytoene/squalene synthase family protein n=1 Tax=Micrococcus porci TaxID=2856555 RepID=UPI003CE680FA